MNSWIIVKPETVALHSANLELFLKSNQFEIFEKRGLSSWSKISNEIYADSEKITLEQLAIQNETRVLLFGNYGDMAQLWLLNDILRRPYLEQFSLLSELKHIYRSLLWSTNLSITISDDERMSPFHLTFFHVPDPNSNAIYNEWRLING